MISSIEELKSGWFDIHLALTKNNIDKTIEYLEKLKSGQLELDHFHFYATDFSSENGGIADIQISLASDAEKSNMDLGA